MRILIAEDDFTSRTVPIRRERELSNTVALAALIILLITLPLSSTYLLVSFRQGCVKSGSGSIGYHVRRRMVTDEKEVHIDQESDP